MSPWIWSSSPRDTSRSVCVWLVRIDDGFLRLRADLVRGLLHDRRVVGEHLIELRGLLAEGLGGRARVFAEHPVGLDRALVERRVDRLQPLGEGDDDGLRPLGHGLVERRRSAG